jgi:hypothetical protein
MPRIAIARTAITLKGPKYRKPKFLDEGYREISRDYWASCRRFNCQMLRE